MINNRNFSQILVPTDFTTEADCAVNHAVRIAKSSESELTLLHVINRDSKLRLKSNGAVELEVARKLEDQVNDIMVSNNIRANYVARDGSIFSTIGDVAKDKNATMLVMGTHGVLGIQHFTGAYALKVITTSPVPVIIVQKKNINPEGYKKIILPIDSTVESKFKVIDTVNLAKKFNSEIHIFAAYEEDEFLARKVQLNCSQVKKHLDEQGIRHVEVAESRKKAGNPNQLINYAVEVNADLIVTITQRDFEISEFILGPYNQKLINNQAQIPVMCINPSAEIFKSGSLLSQ